jgi:hypothetical protein
MASALLIPGAASAQAGGDASAATELFRQGREALETKDYATACAKFDESYRLDPHVGTLISLAECEEAIGKLARARAHWQQAIGLAHSVGDRREAFAGEKFGAIDPRVPRLTLRRGASAPPALTVSRDDMEIGGASFDSPLPVEIGPHTVSVSAVGFATNTVTVELKEGESKEVVLEPGAPLPPPPPVEEPAKPVVEPPAPEAPPRPSPLRPIALAVGGVGVVALGVGTFLGVQVIEAKSQGDCSSNGNSCNGALREGNVSNVAFASGGVLLVTAAAFWFLAPTTQSKKPVVRVTPGVGARAVGIGLEGAF